MPERGSAPEGRPAGLALRAVLSRVGKGADMADGNRIAGGYTKEVHCGRCQGLRWVRVDVPEPYTCQRCRMVLAGRPTVDPVSPMSPEARQAARERMNRVRTERRSQGESET